MHNSAHRSNLSLLLAPKIFLINIDLGIDLMRNHVINKCFGQSADHLFVLLSTTILQDIDKHQGRISVQLHASRVTMVDLLTNDTKNM